MSHQDPDIFGSDLFGPIKNNAPGLLGERFVLPPFSVIHTARGWWQDRKRAWLSLGFTPSVGRGVLNPDQNSEQSPPSEHTASLKGGLTYGMTMNPYGAKKSRPSANNRKGGAQGVEALLPEWNKADSEHLSSVNFGTSAFDPVLCELMVRWYCPPRGMVVDPFCGGPTLGIVSAHTGRKFWGCDIRRDQVASNYREADKVFEELSPYPRPTWMSGDVLELMTADRRANARACPRFDFLFTSPPYFDLEKYSKDERDLSNMDYKDFLDSIGGVAEAVWERLKPDRFCAVIVGDVRDGRGNLRGLPAQVCKEFQTAGFKLYNEMILVTAVGSLSVRTGRQFENSRKVGRCHQTIYVFLKGDAKKAAAACGGKT